MTVAILSSSLPRTYNHFNNHDTNSSTHPHHTGGDCGAQLSTTGIQTILQPQNSGTITCHRRISVRHGPSFFPSRRSSSARLGREIAPRSLRRIHSILRIAPKTKSTSNLSTAGRNPAAMLPGDFCGNGTDHSRSTPSVCPKRNTPTIYSTCKESPTINNNINGRLPCLSASQLSSRHQSDHGLCGRLLVQSNLPRLTV